MPHPPASSTNHHRSHHGGVLIGVVGVVVGLAVGFAVGYVFWGVKNYVDAIFPEYDAAQVISDVTDFVRENRRWPKSGDDLDRPPLEGVTVDWSLDLASADRHDVLTSIIPSTRAYRTYPHADGDLDFLWETVQEARAAAPEGSAEESPPKF